MSRRLIVDLRADNVGRQQIRRELNSMKRRIDRLGERAHGERLRESRHTLEQHMPTREKTDEQPIHHVILADDPPRDLMRHVLYQPGIRCG